MCVIGKANKACGKIQALNWGTITFASILVGIFGGELAQNLNYRIGYLCLIPVLLIAFLVTRFLKEEVVDNKVKFTDLKKVFLNKQFLLVCLFLFLYKFSPSFGTVLAFKQRDIFQWSERFIGYLGAFLSVFEILGAILYFKFSQRINLKKWIFWSVILGGITTLLYLYYTSITAIVYGILFSFIGMFIHLICMDFMARNSIKNLETCSFAMLCAISNLSATASSLTGAYLYPKVGLDWLIVISALTSFVCLFFITKIKF